MTISKKTKINHKTKSKRAKFFRSYNMNNFLYGGNSGGGYEGASNSRVTRRWRYSHGTADSEILSDLQILRERSRDLYRNNAVGRGAIQTLVSNVIASGLKLQAVIDRDYLKLSEEAVEIWEINVERKFNNWANTIDCDASRMSDFFDLQNLAFSNYLQSGECFILLPILERNGHSQVCLQTIEADMVRNSPGNYNNKHMRDGIEIDGYGAPVKYSIRMDMHEWKKVNARGEKTGRPNIIHLFRQERPGQSRGVPFLASVLENIKELGRYNKSELAAAVIQSMFTVFVTSNNENALNTVLDDELNTAANAATDDDFDYTLAPGAVYRLEDNEGIELANPARPNSSYDQFILAQLREIGMALQIPVEILTKQFNSSYSASRASRLEAWKFFMSERNRFARRFCQVIYEEWLTEEILNLHIPAFGFLEDYDTKKAWLGAQWVGESMGQIDENKEVKAAAERVKNNFSTRSQETIQMGCGDFMQNLKKQIREARALLELKKIESETKQLETAQPAQEA